ncbi:MAG: sulfatase [bacterium]
MKRRIIIITALLFVVLLASLYLYFNHKTRPNIVIILIDALRKDHLGCYGYHRETSPNIDAFAGNAVKFMDTVSTCSWTSPSIASLFTCLYVSSHGLKTHSQKSTDILDLKFETLAEALKKNGYTTSAFIANRWIREEFNYNQGFDSFEQVGGDIPRPSGALVREKVTKWLQDKPKGPFFLYIHFMDVHGPYLPPYPYNTFFKSEKTRDLSPQEYMKLRYLKIEGQMDLNFYISQYDGGIRYCDYHVGKIIQYLKENGLFDDTIIIITSDHGEAFFEHGECDHGFTLYNEEIEVPLLMRFPHSMDLEINTHIKPLLIDIGVTLLDIIGAQFPYEVDGLSLVSQGKKRNREQKRQRIYSEEYMKGVPKIAVIEDDMKYIYHIPQEKIVEVYNLREDKGEKENLLMNEKIAASNEQREEDIGTWLHLKETRRDSISKKREQTEIDPLTLEQLKSLGYIQYEENQDN